MQKLRRLAALAADATIALVLRRGRAGRRGVARGDASSASTLGGLVEIEVGMQRCGVAPGQPARRARAAHRRCAGTRVSRPAGVSRYGAAPADARRARARDRERGRGGARDARGAASGGTRVRARHRRRNRHVSHRRRRAGCGTNCRPDRTCSWTPNTRGSAAARRRRYTEFQHSLFVLATVMSVPTRERAIVDAGLKSYSGGEGPAVGARSGRRRGDRCLRRARQAASSGPKRGAACASATRCMLIPGHCDPTINLHDWYVAVREGRVEALWPITARGASS